MKKAMSDGSTQELTGFAASAMIYVIVEELIPEMSVEKHSHIGTVFFAVCFSNRTILDVALR